MSPEARWTLASPPLLPSAGHPDAPIPHQRLHASNSSATVGAGHGREPPEIGRASCRERAEISGVAGALKKKKSEETGVVLNARTAAATRWGRSRGSGLHRRVG